MPSEASEMFHNENLMQNTNQKGLLIHSISTTERVLRYGENNRVAFFEHPITVEGEKERIIKIYATLYGIDYGTSFNRYKQS